MTAPNSKKTNTKKVIPKNNKGLGRGLAALMGVTDKEYSDVPTGTASRDRDLPIEFLVPNPYQPRHYFDEEKSADLIQSIKTRGILQPLLVRRRGELDEYEIIAGERRWRAAQAAGLHNIPVLIREMSDSEALEIAIIENIQRHDLSSIEEGLGYQRLMDEFHHTQEQLSHMVGKSRSHVANMLRLLTLPNSVQQLVSEGKLSMGHGRALVNAPDAKALAERVISEGLSVRQIETILRSTKKKAPTSKKKRQKNKDTRLDKDADTMALEKDLSLALGLSVSIEFNSDESGELRLEYKSLEQLDDICHRLNA